MSGGEISTIIFMAVIGYVVVSAFIRWKEIRDINRSAETEGNASSYKSSQQKNYTDEPKAWHDVLGVPETADSETIKSAYRSLVRQYHPDKVNSLGKEFSEIAEQKTKEINRAYQIAQQVKNFS